MSARPTVGESDVSQLCPRPTVCMSVGVGRVGGGLGIRCVSVMSTRPTIGNQMCVSNVSKACYRESDVC